MAAPLPWLDRLAVRFQHGLGWLCFPVTGLLCLLVFRGILRLRMPTMEDTRRKYKGLRQSHRGPILFCSNHLTFMDGVLISWALGGYWQYTLGFHTLPWNVPERRTSRMPLFWLACLLGHCIRITRMGDRERMKRDFGKVTSLMRGGSAITIFPEGGRSRTGRFELDKIQYGCGRLARTIENTKVICLYLRGEGRERCSRFPRRGEVLTVDWSELEPQVEGTGLRATRDVALQIGRRLQEMEEDYFARRQ